MPIDTAKLPAFAKRLGSQSDEDRKKALAFEHPDYTANKHEWKVLLDAFEGRGGFQTGSYLWKYPAEDNDFYLERMAHARYHNHLATIVDLYTRFVFTQEVKRASKSDEYNAWTNDVDGAGTPLTDLLKRMMAVGLANGHAGVLVDKTPEPAAGPSKADEKSRIFATLYTATSILDWRLERNQLTAVKLSEAGPQPDITGEADDESFQYLLWALDGWARYDEDGKLLGGDTPNLGMVPLVVFRPKPSILSTFIGRPLVVASILQALYNRAAEEDDVLRAQSFSTLIVEVDPNLGDVEKSTAALGKSLGTSKALVIPAKADYKTPDQATNASLRENQKYLVEEIFRSAHVRTKRDSLDAESAESIRLQHSELNEMLQGVAKALILAEQQIARAFFAWSNTTPEAAQAAYEAAELTLEYPSEFFLDPLINDLEALAEGIRMGLGETMTKRMKKRAALRIEPDMPEDVQAQVFKEIDAMKEDELKAPEQAMNPPEVPNEEPQSDAA